MAKARKCPECGSAMEGEFSSGGTSYYCDECDTEWMQPLNRGPLRKLDGAASADPVGASVKNFNSED